MAVICLISSILSASVVIDGEINKVTQQVVEVSQQAASLVVKGWGKFDYRQNI